MVIANFVTFFIVLLGSLNWGLVGIFNFNLVTAIFGAYPSIATIIVYVLVMLSAAWLVVSCVISGGRIEFMERRKNS